MISKELVQKARQTDLVAYLTEKGEELKRIGSNYTLKQHDSLFIKGNMFCWYSRNKQGNSIDFLMCYYGMTFKQAVEELTQQTLSRVSEVSDNHPEASQEPLQQPTRAENEKRVLGYLCKRRGLKNSLIFALIKQGKLYQDTHGNCNFVITDWNEKIIGTEIAGTGDTRYKQMSKNHSGYGFHIFYGDPDKITDILYFESAIDLISCYQLYQDKFTHHLFVSLAGVKKSTVLELYKLKPKLKHWLCVDNDDAGTDFITEIRQEIDDIHVFRPPEAFKDWNDYLCGAEKKTN